jgi:hypothetical protein
VVVFPILRFRSFPQRPLSLLNSEERCGGLPHPEIQVISPETLLREERGQRTRTSRFSSVAHVQMAMLESKREGCGVTPCYN